MAARDIIQAAGGSAATNAAVYVEDVFSTYLYTGTGASQTINNGIDLATKGGLVWLKGRSGATDHALYDTIRGATYDLVSNSNPAATTQSTGLTAFGTTGFTIGTLAKLNTSAATYTSFAFRKQAKFFDVVTYTGDGTTSKSVSHSLGVNPGMIIVKRTDAAQDWFVWHRSLSTNQYAWLNSTNAANTYANIFGTHNTSTFTVGDPGGGPNVINGQYVAYLFADSNSGGFGSAGTDSVVACGSFTTDASGNATVSLGWEPQWLLVKRSDSSTSGAWWMADTMRGMTVSPTSSNTLSSNTSGAEVAGNLPFFPSATGFSVAPLVASATYIYLAIRRGPMKTPTDATKVFSPLARTATGAQSAITGFGFSPDLIIAANRNTGPSPSTIDKLRGRSKLLNMQTTGPETTSLSTRDIVSFDQNGFTLGLADYLDVNSTSPFARNSIFWNFARAPGFFDVVCYTGTGVNPTAVSHNLGVVPELAIIKCRSTAARNWIVSRKVGSSQSVTLLNSTMAEFSSSQYALLGSATTTSFSVANDTDVNQSGSTYVAYLFATCPGVSKVFSFTGNGSSQTINCGFAAGARFVLFKRTDAVGDWYVWDTARGIVSANDPHLSLNTTAVEVTTDDTIDPDNSGFIVNQVSGIDCNVTSATYIGLAIA